MVSSVLPPEQLFAGGLEDAREALALLLVLAAGLMPNPIQHPFEVSNEIAQRNGISRRALAIDTDIYRRAFCSHRPLLKDPLAPGRQPASGRQGYIRFESG